MSVEVFLSDCGSCSQNGENPFPWIKEFDCRMLACCCFSRWWAQNETARVDSEDRGCHESCLWASYFLSMCPPSINFNGGGQICCLQKIFWLLCSKKAAHNVNENQDHFPSQRKLKLAGTELTCQLATPPFWRADDPLLPSSWAAPACVFLILHMFISTQSGLSQRHVFVHLSRS